MNKQKLARVALVAGTAVSSLAARADGTGPGHVGDRDGGDQCRCRGRGRLRGLRVREGFQVDPCGAVMAAGVR